jgi:hypothetical protein
MSAKPDILDEMHRLIDAANASSIFLRVLGGLAVRVHSGDFQKLFIRDYPDIDFVTADKDRRKLEPFFAEMGYEPNKKFNVLNGAHRQIYYDLTGMRVDIFIGDFQMCHKLPMNDRLHLDPITVPLAELLLSKAQIVELNRKDALDIASILLYNETGKDDNKKINLDYIAQLCSQDWGLYKTTSINLNQVEEIVIDEKLNLAQEERDLILSRLHQIQQTFEEMPKSLQWKLRDKVGTRVRWYEEVEEVAR